MSQALAAPIDWLLDAGWTYEEAMPCTLLALCGRSALGQAIAQGDSVYSASSHLLSDAIRARATQCLQLSSSKQPRHLGSSSTSFPWIVV